MGEETIVPARVKVKVGDTVHVVCYLPTMFVGDNMRRKVHVRAEVTRVYPGDKIDLKVTDENYDPLILTASPRDDSGAMPDSWHPIEA